MIVVVVTVYVLSIVIIICRYKYKGNELEVKNAKPKVDAMATKRHLSKDSSDSPTKKQKTSNESLTKEGSLLYLLYFITSFVRFFVSTSQQKKLNIFR